MFASVFGETCSGWFLITLGFVLASSVGDRRTIRGVFVVVGRHDLIVEVTDI